MANLPKVLFVHFLYSDEIQNAADILSERHEAECFFEESLRASLERIVVLRPDVVLIHRVHALYRPNSKTAKQVCDEFSFGTTLFMEALVQRLGSDLPKLIIITTTDEYGYPLDMWERDEIVSNVIMPPRDHWDIVLAVRQALYRTIETPPNTKKALTA